MKNKSFYAKWSKIPLILSCGIFVIFGLLSTNLPTTIELVNKPLHPPLLREEIESKPEPEEKSQEIESKSNKTRYPEGYKMMV